MLLPFSSIRPLLLHIITSAASRRLPLLLHLPSLSLHSLHTYIHPDHIPSPSSSSSSSSSPLRAAIRRPSNQDPTHPKSSRSKSESNHFDESKAQLFRLRLSHPHLASRVHFASFRLSFLLSSLSLSNLALHPSTSLTSLPSLFSLLTLACTLLLLLSLDCSSARNNKSLPRSLFLAAFLGYLLSLFILLSPPSIDLFDFQRLNLILSSSHKLFLSTAAALLAAALFSPASRAARSFWLGTDQLRWNLSVVSCGPFGRVLLYLSAVSNAAAPLLWFNPVGSADVLSGLKKHRIAALCASALLQVLAVRPNLQLYLNEAVLCWYQRLHSSRVPDLDYGRAKVFLHNHYICLVATQFLGPPVMVLVLLGLSQMRGNLFSDFFLVGGMLAGCSDAVKECALFLAWWVVFVQGVLMMASLALYRMGFLFVS